MKQSQLNDAEIIKALFEKHQTIEKYNDRLTNSYFTLWSNLINTNAISITAFSVIIAIYDKAPQIIINVVFPISLILTLVTVLLLIGNINFYKKSYYETLESLIPQKEAYDLPKFKKELEQLVFRTKIMKASELIARIVFVINIIAIFFTIIISR